MIEPSETDEKGLPPGIKSADLHAKQARAMADALRIWLRIRQVFPEKLSNREKFYYSKHSSSAAEQFGTDDWEQVIALFNDSDKAKILEINPITIVSIDQATRHDRIYILVRDKEHSTIGA